MKRIIVAVVFGLVAGGLCAAGAFSTGLLKFTTVNLVWILLNRAVMGYAIGASGLRLHWVWNGILTGIVVGSIFSYFLFMTTSPSVLPFINAAMNGVFGLMIEFFTTVVFKQRSSAAPSRIAAAAAVHASA